MASTRIDVSELANVVDEGKASAAVFISSMTASRRVTQAINEAIHRDTLLRRVADRAELDPGVAFQAFLEALGRELPSASESEFTEPDSAELKAAGVDLTGGASDTDLNLVTVARIARVVGSSLNTSECADIVGVTPGRIRQRLAAGSIYAFQQGGGEYRIPRWQLIGREFVPGLETVVPAIPRELHPLTVQALMTSPDVDLLVGDEELSPLGWLATGGDPDVVARIVAEAPSAH